MMQQLIKISEENKKKDDLKTRLNSVFDKIFKTSKEHNDSIKKTIAKFADSKASHLVNLKKLKRNDPHSFNSVENTGSFNKLNHTFTFHSKN